MMSQPAALRTPSSVRRPLRVGITGGIGSGKSVVCKIFEVLGIPIYYADERAKWLMVNDLNLMNAIRASFGNSTYDANGQLNRSYLADKVFHDEQQLQRLNALVHPAVARDSESWNALQVGIPYTLREAALIYEAGIDKQLDKVIVVTAPLEVRIQRVMMRDRAPREAVEARISKQMPASEKVQRADFVIYNDGTQSLIRQVLKGHNQLCDLYNATT
ncbi:MAG TPA: dephospho-CoA kinase [Saprospiraceae bacterium]|nr:dephospho-CoA kinase [Saprospiraceae bacterium]HMP12803.1 dephospho-CoA kinase [Saprospiraceae bacterium]